MNTEIPLTDAEKRTRVFFAGGAGGHRYRAGVPQYQHHHGAPKWIEERFDYLKVFFLGLFLGNAGVSH